ncbi:hypothetical protein AAVH_28121 [Aphelenchoides avenae]|nr:hypothetical protein AAVH_28121 [Aphelenchus avenae]
MEEFIVSGLGLEDFQMDDDSASDDADESVRVELCHAPLDPKLSLMDILVRKSELAKELETISLDERGKATQRRELDILQEMAGYSSLERTMLVTRMEETKSVKPRPTDVLPEYDTQPDCRRHCTIDHDSPFRAVWDWIVLLLVIYTAIVTPYLTASLLRENQGQQAKGSHVPSPHEIIGLIVDILFIVDIMVNFRTTFVMTRLLCVYRTI